VQRTFATVMLVATLIAPASVAFGDEPGFFRSLDGRWGGEGTFRLETDSSPVKIRCRFNSDTTQSSMSLDGSCTGLVVVSRSIGAVVKAEGGRYSGVYRGSKTGPAALNGRRSGNALDLAIRWAAAVNGDQSARLTLEKVGANGMRLTTTDKDPKTGKSVVITRIDLRRL
jgi:hypothetical protein